MNRKGAVTGGYLDQGKSRLKAQADTVKLTKQCHACEEMLQKVHGQATLEIVGMSCACASLR